MAAWSRSLLLAILFGIGTCTPNSNEASGLLSVQELQDMISSLEERRRQLPHFSHRNASSPSQRRLGMTSDSDELEPTKKATCSFDIIGVVLAAARVGTILYFVQDSCKTQETINQKTACAATINGLFATVGFLISFLSDSISACQTSLQLPANCAAVSGNLVAILSIMGGSTSSLENSCRAATIANDNPKWLDYIKEKPEWLKYVSRRLDSTNETSPGIITTAKLPALPTRSVLSDAMIQEIRNNLTAAEFRRVEISQCVFDTLLTSMFFGRGLLSIYNAAMQSPCTVADDFDDQLDQDSTCMVEVSGMITTFDYVAALIALLVSECPEGASIKALCASDAIILVGAISALFQTGTSFLLVCGQKPDERIDRIIGDIQADLVP